MLKVDRGNYSSYNPYYDSPQTIGETTYIMCHCVNLLVCNMDRHQPVSTLSSCISYTIKIVTSKELYHLFHVIT